MVGGLCCSEVGLGDVTLLAIKEDMDPSITYKEQGD